MMAARPMTPSAVRFGWFGENTPMEVAQEALLSIKIPTPNHKLKEHTGI